MSSLQSISSQTTNPIKYRVYGANGWIGKKIVKLLEKQNIHFDISHTRLENREALKNELQLFRPTHVLNTAGITGKGSVDWCESHQTETIKANIVGYLNLMDICHELGIHLTNYSSGCIYEFDAEHTIENRKGFIETDPPNFTKSLYSRTKIVADDFVQYYPNTLHLRIRMPCTDEYQSPKNFISKITRYEKVVDVINSMTDLDTLLPISIDMSQKNIKGIFNFTNSGGISHNEILQMYREIVDPTFQWKNFTLEEQSKILKAGRSNNLLDNTKLQTLYPEIPEIHIAMKAILQRMAKNKIHN